MPSSSAYAAPIDLDLRPGRWERGGRVVAGLLALGALALSDVPLQIGLPGAALAVLFLVRDSAKAARRPPRMRPYADGGVECAAEGAPRLSASCSPQAGIRELMHPATLLQATTFLGLTQLRFADVSEAQHACVLFPDRMDSDTRHRLSVWLATHRPSRAPFPVPRAPRAAASAPR